MIPMEFSVSVTFPEFRLHCDCHVGGMLDDFGTDIFKLYDHVRTMNPNTHDPAFKTSQLVHEQLKEWERRVVNSLKIKEGKLNESTDN